MPNAKQSRVSSARVAPQRPVVETRIQSDDWDSLFGAIEERLRLTVEDLDARSGQPQAVPGAVRIKAIVLDCVQAMARLHVALKVERHQNLVMQRAAAEDQSGHATQATLRRAMGPQPNGSDSFRSAG